MPPHIRVAALAAQRGACHSDWLARHLLGEPIPLAGRQTGCEGGRTQRREVKPSPSLPSAACIAGAFRYSHRPRGRDGEKRGVSAGDEPVLIEIDGLTKRFGSFTAVDNVSF